MTGPGDMIEITTFIQCRINVPAGVTRDLAGNPTSAATYTYGYRPKSPTYNIVSDIANGVSGASLAVAVAAPVVLGTVTTGQSFSLRNANRDSYLSTGYIGFCRTSPLGLALTND